MSRCSDRRTGKGHGSVPSTRRCRPTRSRRWVANRSTSASAGSTRSLAGNLRGAEFDIAQYYNNGLTTEAGHVTSNVVLWPKVYVLSLSQDTFDGLTDEQQGWVREAAEQATQTSVEATYDETTLARELCEAGTRFIPASAEQLDALHAAVAPGDRWPRRRPRQRRPARRHPSHRRRVPRHRNPRRPRQTANNQPHQTPNRRSPPRPRMKPCRSATDSSAEAVGFPEGVYQAEIIDAPFAPANRRFSRR